MNWGQLGDEVVERRLELGYRTREAFAAAVGISPRVVGDVEKARRTNYDRVTIGRLEVALKWPRGKVQSILTGSSRPAHRVAAELAAMLEEDSPLTDDERAQLAKIADAMLEVYRSRLR